VLLAREERRVFESGGRDADVVGYGLFEFIKRVEVGFSTDVTNDAQFERRAVKVLRKLTQNMRFLYPQNRTRNARISTFSHSQCHFLSAPIVTRQLSCSPMPACLSLLRAQ